MEAHGHAPSSRCIEVMVARPSGPLGHLPSWVMPVWPCTLQEPTKLPWSTQVYHAVPWAGVQPGGGRNLADAGRSRVWPVVVRGKDQEGPEKDCRSSAQASTITCCQSKRPPPATAAYPCCKPTSPDSHSALGALVPIRTTPTRSHPGTCHTARVVQRPNVLDCTAKRL